MQLFPPNTPPGQNNTMQRTQSPALHMAMRIRAEQGTEQARRYLIAMEPYLAPAERSHIANQLGISLPPSQQRQNNQPQQRQNSQPQQRQNSQSQRSSMNYAPPAQQSYQQEPMQSAQDFGTADTQPPRVNPFVPPVTNSTPLANPGGMFGGNNNSANMPMQLIQMLSGMNGGNNGAQGGGMNNPMQMMQLFNMLNTMGMFPGGKK